MHSSSTQQLYNDDEGREPIEDILDRIDSDMDSAMTTTIHIASFPHLEEVAVQVPTQPQLELAQPLERAAMPDIDSSVQLASGATGSIPFPASSAFEIETISESISNNDLVEELSNEVDSGLAKVVSTLLENDVAMHNAVEAIDLLDLTNSTVVSESSN